MQHFFCDWKLFFVAYLFAWPEYMLSYYLWRSVKVIHTWRTNFLKACSIISHASKFNKLSTTYSLGFRHVWELKVVSSAQGPIVAQAMWVLCPGPTKQKWWPLFTVYYDSSTVKTECYIYGSIVIVSNSWIQNFGGYGCFMTLKAN
jgi:hypothetical protein